MKTNLRFTIEMSEKQTGGYFLWIDGYCIGHLKTKELLERAILNKIDKTFKPEDMEGRI